jgi:predicted RNase H-like nuclease
VRKSCVFIGLDLAWKIDGNHSGIAVLIGNTRGVRLHAVSQNIRSQAAVIDFIAAQARDTTVVAIDGSLIVRNATGQRPCERLIAQRFGRYHAACHTSNLGRPHARTGMELVAALAKYGFVHDFDLRSAKQHGGRWAFEAYPHPAMVQLFGLEQIIRYKKGVVAEKKRGLIRLRNYLQALAKGSIGLILTPLLRDILAKDLDALHGQALKHYEDSLDAIFCAYLAWHCWRWGADGNEAFGSMQDGYIVVPKAGSSGKTFRSR